MAFKTSPMDGSLPFSDRCRGLSRLLSPDPLLFGELLIEKQADLSRNNYPPGAPTSSELGKIEYLLNLTVVDPADLHAQRALAESVSKMLRASSSPDPAYIQMNRSLQRMLESVFTRIDREMQQQWAQQAAPPIAQPSMGGRGAPAPQMLSPDQQLLGMFGQIHVLLRSQGIAPVSLKAQNEQVSQQEYVRGILTQLMMALDHIQSGRFEAITIGALFGHLKPFYPGGNLHHLAAQEGGVPLLNRLGELCAEKATKAVTAQQQSQRPVSPPPSGHRIGGAHRHQQHGRTPPPGHDPHGSHGHHP